MFNWRGTPYYLAKSVISSREWKTYFREVCRSDLADLSARYLRQLLDHAGERVPFYQKLGLEGRPLSEYPIRTKADLRTHWDQHLRVDLADHPWSRITTSGSTGDTLEVLQDRNALSWVEAADMWYYEHLLDTSRRAYLSASKIFVWHPQQCAAEDRATWTRVKRFLVPMRWIDPFEALSEERLLHYAREIWRARPRYIWGYAGVLYEIARAALNAPLTLPRPGFIISFGETLHSYMRPVIEEAFGCRVYDYYGSAEVGRVAGECSEGYLRVFPFACHVEILDSAGEPALPGQEGRLVLTALHNIAMPPIRYDVADWAEVGPLKCPCGCTLPTLRRIVGRTVEFFVTRNGHLVTDGLVQQSVRSCPWVMGFQVLQRDIDQLTIFFYRPAGAVVSEHDIERVNAQIAATLGTECRIEWQEVEEIPRTPNGKRPYARSLVWESSQPDSLWEER